MEEKLLQTVFRGEIDWKQWHFLTADFTNLRTPIILYNLIQGDLNGVEGKTEVWIAAAEGQLSLTGAPNLSRLPIGDDCCS